MPATYEPIATTTLGSATNSITFSSISSAYTDLRLVLLSFGDNSAGPRLRLNNDSTSLYSYTYMYGTGSGVVSGRASSTDVIATHYATGYPTDYPPMLTVDFFNYAGSTNKTMLLTTSMDKNGSGEVNRAVALYRSTSAISSILISRASGNYIAGTTATLYGILKA